LEVFSYCFRGGRWFFCGQRFSFAILHAEPIRS
jgi:hypothetical protein